MSDRTAFRNVPESKGGTLRFHVQSASTASSSGGEAHEMLDCIGTYGLDTCVGVYFAIDSERCFVAHINAWIAEPNEEFYNTRVSYTPTGAQGDFLKEQCLRQFGRHAEEQSWTPADPHTKSLIERTLTILCPELYDSSRTWVKQVGWYIAEAVKEFLGFPDLEVEREAQGFVVKGVKGKTQLIAKKQSRPRELEGYEERDEEGLEGWAFTVRA